jgi:rhodanese-related sulfurtransferase
MKYLFIDIRKSDEVYSKHFDQSQEYSFYNIPMNMIRFNVETIIKHLDYVDEIYIVCQTANRSQFIKNKYFNDYNRIKVNDKLQFSNLKYGLNNISLDRNTDMKINIVGSNSFNFYSVMRIIQTIMGIIMLSIGIYIYIQLKKEKLLKKINIISLIITTITSIITYFLGHNRAKKETESVILQNLERSISIYQTIINDLKLQMVDMNKKINELETKVDELLAENNNLTNLLKENNANTISKTKRKTA